MHLYSAFRQLARHESTDPPVAPKKAMFLERGMSRIFYEDVNTI